jgi:hypothetical protein
MAGAAPLRRGGADAAVDRRARSVPGGQTNSRPSSPVGVATGRTVRDDSDMQRASSATATFLFTDIEGSTQLLKSHRAEYAMILADHHRLLRERVAAYGGKEIDNRGDSFFVAFTRARDAVLAAAECQRALARHPWPGGAKVRVRMGHSHRRGGSRRQSLCRLSCPPGRADLRSRARRTGSRLTNDGEPSRGRRRGSSGHRPQGSRGTAAEGHLPSGSALPARRRRSCVQRSPSSHSRSAKSRIWSCRASLARHPGGMSSSP